MTTVTYRSSDGAAREIEARDGSSLMEVAVKDGVPGIVAECGGAAACATCHIYIDAGFAHVVGELDDLEDEMLDDTVGERRDTSRLACQIIVTPELDGIVVEIPEAQQ
ncbi:2Fe-2S iron-sulfur cluster-binding protein [Nocardioides sambongensis]|uniref:2Fe-2S iron-sulfur cluster-binding protein n=1 Tax=Nocardioides sambongensis TaxID=2589074 RepID=UPI00112D9F23|nr:2Fe-2S iron-sulfur cluster-binding protein [Nocardioides sambongensis]